MKKLNNEIRQGEFDKDISYNSNNIFKSEVEYIFNPDCFLNPASSDQIGELNFNAKLKNEKRMHASIINILGNIICYKALSFSCLPNFNANSSVISESLSISSANLNINLSDNFSLSALTTIELTSSLLNSLNPNSNSSGILTVNCVILGNNKYMDYLNIATK